jgi:hypothetical protein
VHAPERLAATRVAATSAALDAARWPAGELVLRVAPDEAVVLSKTNAVAISDPHAIVVPETSLFGLWMSADVALAWLALECDWALPTARPAFAQGAVAGLPMKLWLEEDRVLFVVAGPFVADFVERVR